MNDAAAECVLTIARDISVCIGGQTAPPLGSQAGKPPTASPEREQQISFAARGRNVYRTVLRGLLLIV